MSRTSWSEADSATYSALAGVAVPRRGEIVAALVAAVPFERDEAFRIVELGAGDGHLAEKLLDAFPAASVLALDGSELMRNEAIARTARFGPRVTIQAFELHTIDWWDLMLESDLVVSSLCLHHLNDAKKQFLYKAVASRISSRGAMLIADLIDPTRPEARELAAEAWDSSARDQAHATGQPELFARFVEERWNHFRFPDPMDNPAALLHHLVWLKHAGFTVVDCFWLFAGHAVFGGFGTTVPTETRPAG